MIQKLLLVVVVLVLLSSFTACGSKLGTAGTYVNQDGSGDYLELRSDGTFYMEEEGWKFTGDWEAKGNELRLSWMGFVVTGTIEGNAIIDDDGEVWVKEKEKAATPTAPTPSAEKATLTLPLPPGTTSVGDFTVALSSVEREESLTTLHFAVTKASDTGSETATTTVILTDDHGNKYEGTLNIIPERRPDGFLSLLPQNFTYVAGVTITVPGAAPITRLKLGETEKVAFKEVRLVEPSFKRDFVGVSVQPGASVPLGKYLAFTVGRPVAGVVGWSLPVTVTNSEYNPLSVEVKLGLQLVDGSVSWEEAGQKIVEVPGSGQVTLEPQIMTLSEALSGFPLTRLLISFVSKSTGKIDLKVMGITPDEFPPLPERLVFCGDWGGSIYVSKTNGSGATRLSGGRYPAWSPDGTRIAYTGRGGIMIMNADGQNNHKIADEGSRLSWAPNGERLAFEDDDYIYIIDVDGSNALRLTSGESPSWSPQDSLIAFDRWAGKTIFDRTHKIFAINPDGSGERALATGESPAWSPGGTQIAFVDGSDLFVMNSDGSDKQKLTGNVRAGPSSGQSPYGIPPAWSLDGAEIVFARLEGIYIIRADGSTEKRIDLGLNMVDRVMWGPALKLTEKGLVPLGMVQPAVGVTPTPAPAATLEVANLDRSELTELREVVEKVLAQAKIIADEDQKGLVNQAEIVLDAIRPESELQDIVAEKTEGERLILDLLKGIFGVGAEHFLKIPSPITWAIADSAEELGNQIAEWQVLGQLSFAKVTQPDTGMMEVVYHKRLGEVWVDFYIYNPVGRVCMYIPVEPALVSSEGGGNILLSEGVRPVIEKCRIAYRFDDQAVTPNASLSQTTGPVGTEITVNGSGFTANAVVNITYDDTKVASTVVHSDGTFRAAFSVPPSTAGNHTITVTDSDNTVQCNFILGSTPPPIPHIYTWRLDFINYKLAFPNEDERLEHAICLTLDEENLAMELFPGTNARFHPEGKISNWEYSGETYSCEDVNVEFARQLVAEAGYPDGLPLRIVAAPSSDEGLVALVEAVKVRLRPITSQVTVVFLESLEELEEPNDGLEIKRIQ